MRKTLCISAMLKDNMIISWRISPNSKKYPHDYYKDFYYADEDMENCDEIYEVKYMLVEFEEDDITSEFNNYIFNVTAREFYKHWKIHPNHWGKPAYYEGGD